jgi:D-alanyl-D-alanine carboxypeptidase
MTRRHKINRILLGVVLIGLTAAGAFAADRGPITPEAVDRIVRPVMEKAKIPGLSIAVSPSDGRTIERAYGMANLEHRIPVTRESVFEIGSLSKTFTALGILLLEEEGRLRVDDKLAKYFPGFRGGGEITLRHLLQHTSGIKEMLNTEPIASSREKDRSPQEVVKILESLPLDFEPGQRAQYSNSGCILLGLVIEKISGVPFADFLAQRIVKPLGMANTRLAGDNAIVPNRAAGYELDGGAGDVRNAKHESLLTPYASGAVLSTPSDLVKLKKALKAGDLLKQASLDAMLAPARLNDGRPFEKPGTRIGFGYCLELVRFGKHSVPGKMGGISGFNAYFGYLPEKDLMIALTANLENSLGPLIEIFGSILDAEEGGR